MKTVDHQIEACQCVHRHWLVRMQESWQTKVTSSKCLKHSVFIGVCVPTWSGPMSPCSAARGHRHVGSGVRGRRPGQALSHTRAGHGAWSWSCCRICGTWPHSLTSGTQALPMVCLALLLSAVRAWCLPAWLSPSFKGLLRTETPSTLI